MRVTTAFNRLLRLDGVHVRLVDIENDTHREIFVEAPEKPEGIDITAAEEVDVAEIQVLEHADDLHVAELIQMPESQTLEFKRSMRYDAKTGGANKAVEQVIVKSVSGLMNAQGGVLLLGVSDDGDVLGVERTRCWRTASVEPRRRHLV